MVLDWIEIDDQTQQRMMEVKKLHETGYNEEIIRDPYEEYLVESVDLFNRLNRNEISIEKYGYEIQLVMNQYEDAIKARREALRKSA